MICRAVQGTAVTHSAGRHGQFPGARHKLQLPQIGRCSRGSGGEVDGEGAAALLVSTKTHFGTGHIGVGLQGITDALCIHGGVARVGHFGRSPTAQLQGKAFAGLCLGDGEPLLLVGSRAQRQQGDRIGDLALAQGQFEAALGAHAQGAVERQRQALHLAHRLCGWQGVLGRDPSHVAHKLRLGGRV